MLSVCLSKNVVRHIAHVEPLTIHTLKAVFDFFGGI